MLIRGPFEQPGRPTCVFDSQRPDRRFPPVFDIPEADLADGGDGRFLDLLTVGEPGKSLFDLEILFVETERGCRERVDRGGKIETDDDEPEESQHR